MQISLQVSLLCLFHSLGQGLAKLTSFLKLGSLCKSRLRAFREFHLKVDVVHAPRISGDHAKLQARFYPRSRAEHHAKGSTSSIATHNREKPLRIVLEQYLRMRSDAHQESISEAVLVLPGVEPLLIRLHTASHRGKPTTPQSYTSLIPSNHQRTMSLVKNLTCNACIADPPGHAGCKYKIAAGLPHINYGHRRQCKRNQIHVSTQLTDVSQHHSRWQSILRLLPHTQAARLRPRLARLLQRPNPINTNGLSTYLVHKTSCILEHISMPGDEDT